MTTSQTTDTIAVPAPKEPARRAAAIVGTAQTWKLTPWNDLGVDILSLNDGYMLGYRGTGQLSLPRHTVHFDLHPFNEMNFRTPDSHTVSAFDVPVGAYLRPQGHLKWLRSRPFPVFVNTVPDGWPATVKAFPRKELEAKYGTYFTSTPAWMLVWAIEQGYNEIHIYGIHLATEWEYLKQRPCMEYWIRHAMDRGVKIILPAKCPLLKSQHVYAYEPKPELAVDAMKLQIAKLKQEGLALHQSLAALPFYARGRKADLLKRLEMLELELADARQTQARLQQILMSAA